MSKFRVFAAVPLLAVMSTTPSIALTEEREVVVNAIVASVDGKPITLMDLSRRLYPQRRLTLKEASLDPEAHAALDSLVLERVILGEAETKRIVVSDEELNRYVDEVARRNNLTRDGFEKALQQEHKSLDEYKNAIRIDILKSKLATSIAQTGVGVSNDEISAYLTQHPELTRSGSKMKLAQILVGTESRSTEQALALAEKARSRISSGESFSSVAREISEGAEAKDGGMLGVIPEKDLQSDIFDAVFSLKPGEISPVVKTASGYHLFQVLERMSDEESENSEKIREEVRRTLLQQKLETKMTSFFTAELLKSHSIDRKI